MSDSEVSNNQCDYELGKDSEIDKLLFSDKDIDIIKLREELPYRCKFMLITLLIIIIFSFFIGCGIGAIIRNHNYDIPDNIQSELESDFGENYEKYKNNMLEFKNKYYDLGYDIAKYVLIAFLSHIYGNIWE